MFGRQQKLWWCMEAMQVGSIEAARAEVADAVKAMGWGAAEAAIMEVVQALVDEEGESAERALGV